LIAHQSIAKAFMIVVQLKFHIFAILI